MGRKPAQKLSGNAKRQGDHQHQAKTGEYFYWRRRIASLLQLRAAILPISSVTEGVLAPPNLMHRPKLHVASG